MVKSEKARITKADVVQYDLLYPLLTGILNEMRELSKKKQDGVLNALKAKTINKILQKVKALLKNELSNEFLELLDEEMLPTNSDAVIIIVQFQTAMAGFSEKNQIYKDHKFQWVVKD